MLSLLRLTVPVDVHGIHFFLTAFFLQSNLILLKLNSRNSNLHWNTTRKKESSSTKWTEIPQLCQKNKRPPLQHMRNRKRSRHWDKKTTPPVNTTEAAALWGPFRRPIKMGPSLKFVSNCCHSGSNESCLACGEDREESENSLKKSHCTKRMTLLDNLSGFYQSW